MNKNLTICLFSLAMLTVGTACAQDHDITAALFPTDPPVAEIQRAREMIRHWENDRPEKGERVLRIVYWTPADRDPQPEYRERLTRVMRHIQEFYDVQMAAYGFTGRTIRLEFEKDGLLRIPVAKGSLKSSECSEADHSDGRAIRKDCAGVLRKAGIDADSETLVIFCNLTDWDPEKRTMSHHSPYYASGSSVGGTAWQVDSRLLDSAHLGVKDRFLTDQQYGRVSLGKYNSIFVGGVCHELGHALGLPHCRECGGARAGRGTALMGSGNRTYGEDLRGEGKGSFITLPHALKLAVHPQFSGSIKELRTPAKVRFRDLRFAGSPKGLEISGRTESNLPCHAVLAYADPAGGADYDSAISTGIPKPDGTFVLTIPLTETRSKPALLSLVGVCANGAATASVWSNQAFSLPCRIDAHGLYDPSPAVAMTEVDAHLAAVRAGGLKPEQLSGLSTTARECLRRVSLPDHAKDKPTPAAVPDGVRSLPLSDTKPESASTGYGGVHFDRTMSGDPLIGPEGPASHGLWAHANSSFTFDLGGKWLSLTGSCGLLRGADGPIRAHILVDGTSVWESREIERDTLMPFAIKLNGASKLTLVIKGTKGITNAHGAWFEPTLSR